jgi:hypothetical protein
MNHSARGLSSLGRNGDTMLVHMNPTEVASLQRIAQVGGTSMTVNPRTGLPEAFNLKALLPMVAGGLSMLIPGMQPIGAGLIGGATGLATGDKELSPLARFGIGALGGFGTAGAVQGLTAAAGGAAGAGAGSSLGLQGGASTLGANAAVTPTLSNIGTGFSNVLGGGAGGTAARTAFSAAMPFGKLGLAAATAPAVAEAAKTPTLDIPEEKFKYYTTSYNPGEVNENFGQPGQNYFTGQGYGEMVEHEIDPNNPSKYSYGAAAGGQVDDFHIAPLNRYSMAEGGQVPPMSPQRSAIDAYINNLNSKLTAPPMITPRPAPSTPTNPNAPNYMNNMGVSYDPTTQSFSGSDSGMGKFGGMGPFGGVMNGRFDSIPQRASGGITSLGAYSDGGRLLKGPGDGVSDDIPATIHRDDGSKQEARLADGEFVVDARTVSELGNGSTEAGARKLYDMVDRVHATRRKAKLGKDSKAEKYLPK